MDSEDSDPETITVQKVVFSGFLPAFFFSSDQSKVHFVVGLLRRRVLVWAEAVKAGVGRMIYNS